MSFTVWLYFGTSNNFIGIREGIALYLEAIFLGELLVSLFSSIVRFENFYIFCMCLISTVEVAVVNVFLRAFFLM